MNWSLNILLVNSASTWFLVGLIWMVQVVHYPLFKDVGDQNFIRYQLNHQTKITTIVGPAMLIELVTAILMIWYPMETSNDLLMYSGLALVAFIWMSTAFIQVPCHRILSLGFDAKAHKRLVDSNWIRTALWTVRGFLVFWMLFRAMSNGSV